MHNQIELTFDEAQEIAQALVWAEEMFLARDEMNAAVHCTTVRLSPITLLVRGSRRLIQGQITKAEVVAS